MRHHAVHGEGSFAGTGGCRGLFVLIHPTRMPRPIREKEGLESTLARFSVLFPSREQASLLCRCCVVAAWCLCVCCVFVCVRCCLWFLCVCLRVCLSCALVAWCVLCVACVFVVCCVFVLWVLFGPLKRVCLRGPCVVVLRRCPTLPHPPRCSTIGAVGLSFRVRNGCRAFPPRLDRRKLVNRIYVFHVPPGVGGVWVGCDPYSG